MGILVNVRTGRSSGRVAVAAVAHVHALRGAWVCIPCPKWRSSAPQLYSCTTLEGDKKKEVHTDHTLYVTEDTPTADSRRSWPTLERLCVRADAGC